MDLTEIQLRDYTDLCRRVRLEFVAESGESEAFIAGRGVSPSCGGVYHAVADAPGLTAAELQALHPVYDLDNMSSWLQTLECEELVERAEGRYFLTDLGREALPHCEY